ncbi:hypothetical protein [Klebsiella pneumoniae]|uniref:hypothetical protein n=1 Tax=Klebsiella pneumoniae TaxID=573 RepID=UPI0026586EAF|nr:hypothetical protein [Klebsiella pneumoniae]MEA4772329.1 hypothetical protein [Klebsiella pneumoniae]HBR7504845.1 hypothetical protein [Klebsiella pneumoniae]HCQ6978939.1 hypothetical protein [Klebsiella pneumoniae]
MAKKQYGIMPPFPHLVAMLRGSQHRHFVFGIDWWHRHIIVLRDGKPELVPIEDVKFVEPTEEEIKMLSKMQGKPTIWWAVAFQQSV